MASFQIESTNSSEHSSSLLHAPTTGQSQFSFQFLKQSLDAIDKSADVREQLLQYNLHSEMANNLSFTTFRFHSSSFNGAVLADYETLLKEFFASYEVQQRLGLIGEATPPVTVTSQPLALTVLTMDFFDRLYHSPILSAEGRIRGCFDETFDGLTVGDLLREFFANEDSENSSLFKESERREFIFHLLRTLVLGGSLCQPETNVDRYLSLTKALYKELVTVYKDAASGEVRISGKAFEVQAVSGLELFPAKANATYSHLHVLVDPMKKQIVVVKNSFHNFW